MHEPSNISNEAQEEQDELYERFVITVDKGQELLRIDKFLMNRLENATRNKLQKSIDMGFVLVNGKQVKTNYKIRPADEIIIYTDNNPEDLRVVPESMPLDIVFEDEHVLVVNKPAGLVVHPGVGNYNGTLLNGVMHHFMQQGMNVHDESLPRLGMVHRIDKHTSGLLVLGKTEKAILSLGKQFFNHSVQREYVALVWGNVEADKGTIVGNIGRSPNHRKIFTVFPDGDYGKHAVTHYEVLERMNYVTAVRCVLETGRTHQIRVHMKFIGHTLFNDDTYGGDQILAGTVYTKYKQFVHNCFQLCNRQALHARTLGFVHPGTQQQVNFEAPLTGDFVSVWEKWRNYATRSV
jgi:23S rRNA pseudouridine1911/1915/1917 synthase